MRPPNQHLKTLLRQAAKTLGKETESINKAAKLIKETSTHVAARMEQQQSPIMRDALSKITKQVETDLGVLRRNNVKPHVNMNQFSVKNMTKDVFERFIQDIIFDQVVEVLNPEEDIAILRVIAHLNNSQFKENINSVNAQTNKQEDNQNANYRDQIAAIKSLDPNIIDDLLQFFDKRITGLSSYLATASEQDLIAVRQEIFDAEHDAKTLFSSLYNPSIFCEVGKAILNNFANSYDLSKERKSFIFRSISEDLSQNAKSLEERLTFIRQAPTKNI